MNVLYSLDKVTPRDSEGALPEPTPDRAGIEPPKGALYPSQILARNLGAVRRLRGWRQELVAERMNFLGHPWTRQTVGEAEQGRRNVTVDELLSLALVLEITISQLLDARPGRIIFPDMKEPNRKVALVRPTSGAANYANTVAPEMLIDASDLHGILCGHEVDVHVTWDNLEHWRLRKFDFLDRG
jgi:transcriptional regulator with XRE-family HTH domain